MDGTKFWFETEAGEQVPLHALSQDEALAAARRVYADADPDPSSWLVKRDADGAEDCFLVPSGPACEEFTWMPRSMWKEGGALSLLD